MPMVQTVLYPIRCKLQVEGCTKDRPIRDKLKGKEEPKVIARMKVKVRMRVNRKGKGTMMGREGDSL